MIKTELIKRSPLRMLEKSIQEGLHSGGLSIIASTRGVGKTACLIHLATDQLLQGKPVIHVSFAERPEFIMNWYETIFKELSKTTHATETAEIHNELIRHRVIINFDQYEVTVAQIRKSISTIISEGNFKAKTVVIDGYDFLTTTPEFIKELALLAKDLKLSIWMTADIPSNKMIAEGIPETLSPYVSEIATIINLNYRDEYIHLKLVKNHLELVNEDLNLQLDPKTMLIIESAEFY